MSALGQITDICSATWDVRVGQIAAIFSAAHKLLRSDNSDAAKFALLNEFDKTNVRFVEGVVSHWRSSLSGFFT